MHIINLSETELIVAESGIRIKAYTEAEVGQSAQPRLEFNMISTQLLFKKKDNWANDSELLFLFGSIQEYLLKSDSGVALNFHKVIQKGIETGKIKKPVSSELIPEPESETLVNPDTGQITEALANSVGRKDRKQK